MNPASVGFQCPSCVREGARSVRAPRTPYGGAISARPGLTSQVLIALNVGVWLLITATGASASAWVDRLGLIPAGRCEPVGGGGYYPGIGEVVCGRGGGVWIDGVGSGAVWQLLTSAFSHVDVWHVGFNMLALWFLGPQLESVLGRARFLALYVLSALAGSAAVLWLSDPASVTIGASGAVFGLIGALLVVGWKVGGDLRPLLVWLAINVVITVGGRDFISWQGHLGGFVGGVLVAAVLVLAPREQRARWQALGLGVLTLLVIAALTAGTLLVTP
ncbi:rhomboid family intramembrane serine protease [Nocardioides massiliensis]|uniref:Membrane associated rhomboid family serine protease n=1 Tax=Nocardioides massiliensis TaxID=1325935 RepID=A0ABT9NLJ3_9ACTN|nr:rhomboid family intramembrane serine protease [Nocardioides massiliensis]MDP9821291.1 membrane associated rhomboid family serine protease [Nocardioides massiliensis]